MARPEDRTAGVMVTLADLARDVVAVVDPDQLGYLEQVTVAYETGRLNSRRTWLGGTVRSGVDPNVLGDVIYPLLTGTVAQVVGASAFAGLRRRRWWRRRSVRPSARVTLTLRQVDAMHAACIRHAMALGLDQAEATILADAVQSVLLRGQLGDQD